MKKVCMLVDWMAQPTMDDEYDAIEERIKEILSDAHFERNVFPHQLMNKTAEVYIIDFGGVLPGADDMIINHMRSLQKQIEDKPNTLFVIWTMMTERWYMSAVVKENPELVEPNVIFRDEVFDYEDANYWANKMRKWFDLPLETE